MRTLLLTAALLLSLAGASAADTVERPDGTLIHYYLDRPAADRYPIVVILQGSECLRVADKYGPFVQRLNAEGVAVLRVEKPGLTARTAPGECPTEYLELNTLDRRVLDLLEVASELRRDPHWDGRLGLAGGSEGGVVAAMAAPLIPETRAVVLLASAGGLTFGEELLHLVPASQHAEMRTMYERVRQEPLPSREWLSDGKLARNTWLWWSKALPVAAVRSLLRTGAPILMVHGTADGATPLESAERLEAEFARAGKTNLEFRRYPGGHSPPPEVVEEALLWMLRTMPSTLSAAGRPGSSQTCRASASGSPPPSPGRRSRPSPTGSRRPAPAREG